MTAPIKPAIAQSVSSGTVNGISYSVIGGNNQSVSAKDGGIEITSGNATVLVLTDSITVNGESRSVESYQEVVVDRSTGGLEIRLDANGRNGSISSHRTTGACSFAEFFGASSDLSGQGEFHNHAVHVRAIPIDITRLMTNPKIVTALVLVSGSMCVLYTY